MGDAWRVLVVDDSALMRQMISRFLTNAGMEVVATARDGVDGLEKALALRPDVITLDVEMPRMNGLEMLRRLMAESPTPVVMVSSVTQHQTPAAVEALMLGAVDIVAKPGGAISLNLGDVQHELVAKVRAAAKANVRRRRWGARRSASAGRAEGDPPDAVQHRGRVAPPGAARDGMGGRVAPPGAARDDMGGRAAPTGAATDAQGARGAVDGADEPFGGGSHPSSETHLGPAPVIIGSSTGGPGALSTVLSALPGDFPRPVVVVQHMPSGFTASLAKRLDTLSSLKVREAIEHHRPRPGEVWVAPGGVHLLFDARGRMLHSMAEPHLGVRPAVDLTLESAVDVWGGAVIAVILTGMGVDGARGARKLKRAGGTVLAQDERSCVVYGMPRAVAEMGLADAIRPLSDVAAALTRLAARPA